LKKVRVLGLKLLRNKLRSTNLGELY